MEDILIIDNNSIEETVIDEAEYKDYKPIDSDISLDKSINKIELIEEESLLNESKQVNKSNNIIYISNVNNNNNSLANISLNNFDITDFWNNNNVNINFRAIDIDLGFNINDFDFILITVNESINSNENCDFLIPVSTYNLTVNPNDYRLTLGITRNNSTYARVYWKVDNNTLHIGSVNAVGSGSTSNYNQYEIPVSIKGLKFKTLSNNETPVNPLSSVSGNNIYYNYNIYCDGVSDNSLSYNILNKPLNEYSVSESLLGMSVLFILAFGFVLLMRKAVFRWH